MREAACSKRQEIGRFSCLSFLACSLLIPNELLKARVVAQGIPGRIESEYRGSIFHRGCQSFEFLSPVEDDINLRRGTSLTIIKRSSRVT